MGSYEQTSLSSCMRDKVKKQRLVTVVGTNYVEEIVPDLLNKSFEPYLIKDFSKKHFQVSVLENTFATAGIVLTVLGIEAYRNRIYYLEKGEISKSVPQDLASIFHKKDSSFQKDKFEEFLKEAFVLRDVIVHNHIYKVDVIFDGDWEMLSHRQTLLEGYGDDKKFRYLVNNITRKTRWLGLNVQPAKIGFEDLFMTLILFDTFVGLSEKLLSRSHVPFNFMHKWGEEWLEDISTYLAYFYNQIPNPKFIKQLKLTLGKLRNEFINFLPQHKNYFSTNICPKCGKFGFHQPKKIHKCSKCGFEITPISCS